jgi:DNA-binding response OmpR family regulator
MLPESNCTFVDNLLLMKILIIEDELGLQESLTAFLEKEGFLVEVAADFAKASEKISLYDYDGILLDLGLPGGSGLDLLQLLKAKGSRAKVLILTAKDALDDKLQGLNMGADDYLTKPFHLLELLARIRVILRRHQDSHSSLWQMGNVLLDMEKRTVMVDGQPLHLHKKEFDILLFMMQHPDKLILRATLAEQIWGDQADLLDNFDFVYSQIKNLRKKLKLSLADVEIQAVYGVGYKINLIA